jgi:hypothetical protein
MFLKLMSKLIKKYGGCAGDFVNIIYLLFLVLSVIELDKMKNCLYLIDL